MKNQPVGAVEVVEIPPAEATNPPPDVAQGEFTYVVFGDTQDYIEQSDKSYTNPSFVSRIDWILEQKDQRRIKFVTHLGDVVNVPSSEGEWLIATNQLERLHKVGIPCAFAPGNHDQTWGDTTPITQHLDSRDLGYQGEVSGYGSFDGFPGRQYSKLSDIVNRYSDREAQHALEIPDVAGRGANTYQLLTHEGEDFIFIHLQCSIPTNVLKWVDERFSTSIATGWRSSSSTRGSATSTPCCRSTARRTGSTWGGCGRTVSRPTGRPRPSTSGSGASRAIRT